MKIRNKNSLLRHALVLFWIINLTGLSRTATMRTSELDSLRAVIHSLQSKIQQQQAILTRLSRDFNATNAKVYQYKSEQNGRVNLFARLRMQNALKTSHQLADSIDSISGALRENKSKLQQAYAAAIQKIELEIQRQLRLIKLVHLDKQKRKIYLALVKKLEKEKADYTARLQTMKIDEKGWEKILIEPEDTLRRLKLKTALLEDFLQNLIRSFNALKKDIQKNLNDRKTYEELLDFYKELDESLDDDQDIFDRNRIDELEDKLEDLDRENARLRLRIITLKQDITILNAKIERFKDAIREKKLK